MMFPLAHVQETEEDRLPAAGFCTGKELDPDFVAANSENRRYHFPARFYLPVRAMFGEVDDLTRLLYPDYWLTYQYCAAKPTALVDPDALLPLSTLASIDTGALESTLLNTPTPVGAQTPLGDVPNVGQMNTPPHNDPGPCVFRTRNHWTTTPVPGVRPNLLIYVVIKGKFTVPCCCKEAKVQLKILAKDKNKELKQNTSHVSVDTGAEIALPWFSFGIANSSPGGIAIQKAQAYLNVAWQCTKGGGEGAAVEIGKWYITNYAIGGAGNIILPKAPPW
jgi:hypothetical protein